MTTLRPLHDLVALRRAEAVARSKGGIIIPETAREKPQECVVVAIGPGRRNSVGEIEPLSVAVGDRVLIGKWSGTEIDADGEPILIAKHDDILAVLT